MNAAIANPLQRPRATLSLDLDNLWCYQRSFGLETWRSYPSFLEIAVPRILDFLDRLNLKVTFFVIGRDASDPANLGLLSEIVVRGHEVGNHSFDHELALHLQSREEIEDEIRRAADAIETVTGQRPRGFRGPAFGLSQDLLEVLAGLGYDYDASTCPNSLGLLARLWHRSKASKIGSDEKVVGGLYGSLKDTGQSLRPYLWSLKDGALMEVPVTTLPILRLPFHGTYLNYLADFSPALARGYFMTALRLCKLRAVPPSFLLHASDFLGGDDSVPLTYLPGMKRSAEEKNQFMAETLQAYSRMFEVTPIGTFADELKQQQALPSFLPALGA
ncbi:polysaccharide deacetylase family protein [Denitrobaculum tricleocarpae]|uniref:Chitooligosaccharide deacetylase n=1 Tax=Denitrobaculum tricleocarpae TaxID=2591009 RepID=A0A545U1H5_9PROT|nr:polysaccharide deacetylase family protein [Denitrobaculum tricleocarpae]TQV83339.1 polysaccharide deacetylase family protein [Denitrobaculum tricleocarpae]